MQLIIVESPTKARTLSRFLGKDYSVLATTGHIKDLPKSKLSVDVEHDFKPDYVLVEKRAITIRDIKNESKKAKNIYIATDPDREGEAIAAHVYEVISESEKNNKKHLISKSLNIPISRITFHEITRDAVENAISHPGKINTDLVNAQTARRVLDRLVGYKTSPLLWKKVRVGLSAGRVQTVAVRLIVEREREIEKFKKEEYWEIWVQLRTQNSKLKAGEFAVKLIKIDGKTAKISDGKQADAVVADLEKAAYSVSDIVKKEVRKNPYPPFTTSTMTQAAARVMGWSSKKTMSVAQSLYEEGVITYHRTDSMNLSIAAVNQARDYIAKNYGGNYVPEKPHFYKTKSKGAQEAHEAIRPTDIKMSNDKLQISNSKWEKEAGKLYGLIWKRFMSCQMAASIYDETRIDVEAGSRHPERAPRAEGSSDQYLLRASGQIMKFDGWRAVYGIQNSKLSSNNSETDEVQLPEVVKDEPLEKIKIDPQQKFTQPPARYTEATLIKTLEQLGIGRPSTYAPTISTIQIRQYVEKEEAKFKPTTVGVAVNDFLTGNFDREFEYGFTAEMEKELDDVAEGRLDWVKMMKEFYKPFEKKVIEVDKESKRVKIETEKIGRKCPQCEDRLKSKEEGPTDHRSEETSGPVDGELVIRVGRFGRFISCDKFPDCKYTEKLVEKINMKCPDCKVGEVIVKKSKRGRKFFGCSRYPECKWASWSKPENRK